MWCCSRAPAAFRIQVMRSHLRPAIHQVALASTAAETNQRKTKAVIFDMGGVLVPSPIGIWRQYETDLKLPPGTFLRTLFSAGEAGAFQSLERGEISLSQFATKFSEECTKQAGYQVTIDHTEFLPALDFPVTVFPEMEHAIRCLRAEGIKTALLTNNWIEANGEGMCPIDKSLFDVVVQSCLVKMRKPETRIYEHALSQLEVSADEAVFLDDLGHNLKAANSLGIRTIKVESPAQAVSDLEKELGFVVRHYMEGTKAVPPRLQLENKKVKTYLNWALKLHDKVDPVIRYFEHGQSNPTYYIRYANKDLVLRKKPPGKLLPSAHAVEREYRVMKAVRDQGVPVPKVFGLCDEEVLLGTPFYVMEHVKGRVFKDANLPGMTPAERTKIYSAMNEVLTKIHNVDLTKAGLGDFGKQGGYMKRNYRRWAGQYEACKTREIPAMDHLMKWFPENMPPNERCTLVHGDFKLDNLIFHPTSLEVLAVIDWEMSTLGDPLSDLASGCMAHMLPANPFFSIINDKDFAVTGIPNLEVYLKEYANRMKMEAVEHWEFYTAYACFRYAAIAQGVYMRSLKGQAAASNASLAEEVVETLAKLALKIIEDAQVTPTVLPNPTSSATSSNMRNIPGGLPLSVATLSPRVQELHKKVRSFVHEHAIPLEQEFINFHNQPETKWTIHPKMEELKAKAKAEGLWNLFLPEESDPGKKYGAGLTNVEYAYLCEEMGHCVWSSEMFNCSAPDTGNMEVIVRYGSDELKEQWLKPLLNGEIRSCFCMTEPQVASSDATNIQSLIRREGDHYVINGRKWWSSGACDPRCKVSIFMGKTDTNAPLHKQQSMIVIPMDAPGITIVRPLSVFGSDDAPHGHAEVLFENVQVPLGNMLLGEGRGFEIAQGRLGPGRIHHCMRLIGNCERALELMLDRVQDRVAFGKPLAAQGTIQADIAQSRIEIEQARLLVLKAAHMMDTVGNKVAAPEIAMIKVAVPNMAMAVLDRAMQAFGGMGVCSDTPIATFYTWARVLRLADGPDEVHRRSLARMILKKHNLSKL